MAFRMSITREADTHFRALPTHDQRIVQDAIVARLSDQPTTPTRAIKRLRPNPLAEFELRVGPWRVRFVFDPRTETVVVLRVLPRDRAYRD